MNDAGSNEAHVPPAGQDSTVEDWFGQIAARGAELADALTDEVGEERAEELFNQQAEGAAEQEARHGDGSTPTRAGRRTRRSGTRPVPSVRGGRSGPLVRPGQCRKKSGMDRDRSGRDGR